MDRQKILSAMPYLKLRPSADGMQAFDCPAPKLKDAVKTLRDNYAVEALCDIASIDMGEAAGDARFGAVYHFFSHSRKVYLRLVCMCQSAAAPVLDSIVEIFPAADWHEREAFDMMGIKFEGHPDLRRILMWDAYPWHPLRKDFPLAGREAPLPDSFEDNEDATKVIVTPMEGGPFFSSQGDSFAAMREPHSHPAEK